MSGSPVRLHGNGNLEMPWAGSAASGAFAHITGQRVTRMCQRQTVGPFAEGGSGHAGVEQYVVPSVTRAPTNISGAIALIICAEKKGNTCSRYSRLRCARARPTTTLDELIMIQLSSILGEPSCLVNRYAYIPRVSVIARSQRTLNCVLPRPW